MGGNYLGTSMWLGRRLCDTGGTELVAGMPATCGHGRVQMEERQRERVFQALFYKVDQHYEAFIERHGTWHALSFACEPSYAHVPCPR
jgi:hypothetical protein